MGTGAHVGSVIND